MTASRPRPEPPTAASPAPTAVTASSATGRADLLLALTALPVQDPAAYARAMAATITGALDVDRTDVLRLDPDGNMLVSLGASGALPREVNKEGQGPDLELERLPLPAAAPLTDVVRAGRPYRTGDAAAEPRLPPVFAAVGVRSLLAVPLPVGDARAGLVYLASHRSDAFSAEDQAMLTIVAARVGLLIERAELERRRIELERERAREEARREFVAVVSHELKTPVAVISAYAEALLHRAARAGDAEGERILGRMGEQAARMLGLIDDLLDLQRLETGLLALEEGRVDLAALVTRVAEELQATTTAHRLVVDTAREGTLVVRADRRRIEQVVTNLIENAIKYSPKGGDIGVTARRAPPDGPPMRAMIVVSDHGLGIAPDDLPRVFDRFYQAAGGRLHKGVRGLGLGLYIAREIVERHGGALWGESVEGAGSTFYVTLPLESAPPADS